MWSSSMFGPIKYTFLFLIIASLSACSSSKKQMLPQECKVLQVTQEFQLCFPLTYNGLGFHTTEDGEGFKYNREDQAVRFFFESNSRGNENPFIYSSDSNAVSMKGFEKQMKLGQNAHLFFNENNGLKDLNSNAAICFKFEKKFQVVVYAAYKSSEQSEVEKIAASLGRNPFK